MKKIGFLYVKGSLPGFERFGNLPTHLVKNHGMIGGLKADKELDGLIIPGGSIVESQSVSKEVKNLIRNMDRDGKFILGMCSGFQLLANQTDTGRKSQCPLQKEGLGILDVFFSPMVGTDRVEANVIDDSFLTEGMVGEKLTGFHCHTYGKIEGDANPLLTSPVKRTDYTNNPREITSGVRNDDGNVVGIMVHGALDENPKLVKNILNFIDADENDVLSIVKANKNILTEIKSELGVETGIKIDNSDINNLNDTNRNSKIIMIASTGSDSGKTFITTGLAGSLTKKGYNVGVLKVGPDVRDIVPSLYLNKDMMQRFSSIEIGGLGWMDLNEVLNIIKSYNYDLIIIEGVMSIFTGTLNEKIPFSSAEIAMAANIPIILVSPCNKGGIESAAVDAVAHVEMMDNMGLKTVGIILNKVYNHEIAETASQFIKSRTSTDYLGMMPKIDIKERGNIPEVEIKLEDFCFNAINAVERYLDVDTILKIAAKPEFRGYTEFNDIVGRFNK